mmetsp:Transcript_81443/g.174378  ORF Transcript_81443/g.174378 Transcript_81443/m.174378 type:complete len:232 (-) Transcript_81443:86-781(-)
MTSALSGASAAAGSSASRPKAGHVLLSATSPSQPAHHQIWGSVEEFDTSSSSACTPKKLTSSDEASKEAGRKRREELLRGVVVHSSSNETSEKSQVQAAEKTSSHAQTAESLCNARTESLGSQLHESGKCKPCHYMHSQAGCKQGANCGFCHYDHPNVSRAARPCKSKRSKVKRFAGMLETVFTDNLDELTEVVDLISGSGAQGSYLRNVVTSKVRDLRNSGDTQETKVSL